MDRLGSPSAGGERLHAPRSGLPAPWGGRGCSAVEGVGATGRSTCRCPPRRQELRTVRPADVRAPGLPGATTGGRAGPPDRSRPGRPRRPAPGRLFGEAVGDSDRTRTEESMEDTGALKGRVALV